LRAFADAAGVAAMPCGEISEAATPTTNAAERLRLLMVMIDAL
jgi:hypothetical protein